MAAFVSCVVSRISHILHLSGFRSQRPLLSPSLWIAKRLTYASYMDSCHCPVNMMVPPPSRSKIWKQQYGAKRMWGEWGVSGCKETDKKRDRTHQRMNGSWQIANNNCKKTRRVDSGCHTILFGQWQYLSLYGYVTCRFPKLDLAPTQFSDP